MLIPTYNNTVDNSIMGLNIDLTIIVIVVLNSSEFIFIVLK